MSLPGDYEYHTIWTPELVEIKVPMAGAARRVMAMLLDCLVVLPLIFGLFLAIIFLFHGFFTILAHIGPMLLVSFFVGLFIILWCLYFATFHIFNNGQTLGKMVTGTRLVNQRLGKANAGSCLIRAIFDFLDILLFTGSIGAYMILITPNQQRIPDLIAGTLVILDRDFSQ